MIPKQIQSGFFSGVRQGDYNIQGRIARENPGKAEQYWVEEKGGASSTYLILRH